MLVTDNDFSLFELIVLLPERIRQLFCHVIVAEGIFERQVEEIIGLDYIFKTVQVAAKFATPAINIDIYVLRQFLHIFRSATFSIAVAYQPRY